MGKMRGSFEYFSSRWRHIHKAFISVKADIINHQLKNKVIFRITVLIKTYPFVRKEIYLDSNHTVDLN